MTLHYSLVFMLLVAEIVVFLLLAIPLPLKARRKVFNFLSENPFVAKIQYGLKITFIFILILFVDSVNRVYRVLVELNATEKGGNSAALLATERQEVQARKFYNQRNMYLCGFTLLLLVILNRTYTLILEVLQLEEKIVRYEGPSAAKNAKTGKTGAAASASSEVASLRAELAQKDQDLATLKKQAQGLQREYDALADKYGATQASAGPKKTK